MSHRFELWRDAAGRTERSPGVPERGIVWLGVRNPGFQWRLVLNNTPRDGECAAQTPMVALCGVVLAWVSVACVKRVHARAREPGRELRQGMAQVGRVRVDGCGSSVKLM
jgi:hypothetical protein